MSTYGPRAKIISDAERLNILHVGDTMPDGTKYAGVSPDTGTAMFVAPADAPLSLKWDQAAECAAGPDACGHTDWRRPSLNELNVLFNNRAALGGFDESGIWPGGWYQSSTPGKYRRPIEKRFSDGMESDRVSRGGPSSLRWVRG